MTHLLFTRLDENHSFNKWKGNTYSELLPYLERVFSEIIREFQVDLSEEIAKLVKQLCNPNPRRRGHPRNIDTDGNKYSLERYVSIFDRLARKAEWTLNRGGGYQTS